MDQRAVIDKYRRVQVDRMIYDRIMSGNNDGKDWNELKEVDDMFQVFIYRNDGVNQHSPNLYNLICLDVEGGIEVINNRYRGGRKILMPDYIGRIIYVSVWVGLNGIKIVSFVNEAGYLYHVSANQLLVQLYNNEQLDIPDLLNQSRVTSMMPYNDGLYYIDEGNCLNYVTIVEDDSNRWGIRVIELRSTYPISPEPLRLRHGYMIDDDNSIYQIITGLKYEFLFNYESVINDICQGDSDNLVHILNDEGLIENYFYDGQLLNVNDDKRIIVDKFVYNNQFGMCIERDNGDIMELNGHRISTPGRLYILDELPLY